VLLLRYAGGSGVASLGGSDVVIEEEIIHPILLR
jgi:hypothetical protein